MKRLDKSPRRLAMEIRDKDRIYAEKHLVKFGASVAGAAAVVAMHIGARSNMVVGTIDSIEYSIETNC